jgi:TolB-like protein/tetratricopeptide (TPR) repeat protein
MAKNSKRHPVTIDLNQFKLHIDFKKRLELTLHFNSPSRKFYLSVIAFVVNEMKRLGKFTSIPLEGHHDLLALLNESVGGSAGSSKEESLVPRIYKKWKGALPDLEEAPLFKVLGRKKKYDEGAGKTYPFTEAEKDNWANLFEYIGSEENLRLKFALDKIGAGLDDVVIIYEDSVNGDAWDRFLLGLKKEVEKVPETKPIQPISEAPEVPVSLARERESGSQVRYRRIALIATVVVIVGAAAWGIWELSLKPAQVKKASMKRMAFPLPDKPSIAVLPFVNMSDDRSQEIFTDGLTDDLITDLSKISGLFVIARNSTFVYKGKSLPIQQVAEDLGVRYVLEGSVRREEDQVRINAQLVDATTGQHLWAERFDGNMRDVFSLQDKINQKIVAALAVKLTAGEKTLVGQKGTQNPAAYEEFLKGRAHHLRFTREDCAKAEACFKRAIALDPDYSQAKASLALLYADGAGQGMLPTFKMSYLEVRLTVRYYLTEAMKQPTSTAYQVAAHMSTLLRQFDEAISLVDKALALDPNDPACHLVACRVLSAAGKPAEGLEHGKIALRLDPLNPARYLSYIGLAHFCMGEWEEAVTAAKQALKLNPEENFAAVGYLAAIYAHQGRDEEAKAVAQKFRRGRPPDFVFPPPLMFYRWPFKDRGVVYSVLEGLQKTGLVGQWPEYIHVSKEDQVTGEDLKTLFYPSKIIGLAPDGSEWAQEVTKDGEVIFRSASLKEGVDTGKTWGDAIYRSASLAEGVDTGRSWVEGDRIWFQFQKHTSGIAYCLTTFKNPRGTPQGKNEYVTFSDFAMSTFSPAAQGSR